jgi:hypothetical protein
VHYFDESCCERTDCACKTDFRITNEINTFIIPIFKSADVEASDARVKAANLVEYFTRQSIDDKEDIIDYVKEIEIVKAVNDVSSSNKGVDGNYKYIKDNESGKIIIEVQFDSEPTYDGWVLRNAIAKARANGDIAQLRQPAAIRLAKAPFDAKAFAKLVAAQVRSGRARA